MAIDRTEAALYGKGQGGAFVWGENTALKGLKEFQKQDQLRRMKEDAEIQESMSKISTDGARTQDLPEILTRYQGVKQTFAKLKGTTNPQERIKLQTEYNEKKMEVSRAVEASKTYAATLVEAGKLRLTRPDDLSDTYAKDFAEVSGLSVFDPKTPERVNAFMATAVAPKFDHMGYSKKILDRSVEQIQGKETTVRSGSLTRLQREEGEALNLDNVLNNSINAYTNDRDFKRYVDRTYKGQEPEDALKTYASELYTANKDAYNKVKVKDVASQWDQRAPITSEYQRWQMSRPREGEKLTQGEQQISDRQQWIEDMWNKVPGSGERLKNIVAGVGGYDGDVKIRVNGDKIRIGVPDKRETSVDQDGTVKVKVVPGREVEFSRNDPNQKHKLNALLNDLTDEKVTPSKFNSSPKGRSTASAPSGKSSAKEVPLSKVKSLVGKPGYEGYTEKELVDYYKKQGYKIK
ncbi:hypothetical protein [Sphingobacterium mizutaii]|uniref:hypothetical protein n=1 Tax=Sphingobacterium mizutaii TaxID=1010 RepID=UPI0028A1D2B0|nr:hypothetical protein [Sphingobacterium mizutaii]